LSKVLLENVGKTFDGKKMVLNDFSLQIDDGDFVVLIGPSGCGKTTILNIIAGLECPTTGNVYIDDALSNSVEPKDRDVAMVFQNHALYPHLSVYKNLAFPLKLRKYSKKDIEKEVFFIANLLNIAELLNRKPNQLSGGQQQRVAIGKALIRNPSLFLMDEPLSSLDAELKILLRTEIKELHSKLKSTFVYVTHDQSEAMSLSTKLKVIKDIYNSGVVDKVSSWDDIISSFYNGDSAGVIGGSWWATTIMANEDQKGLWRVTQVPRMEGNTNYTNYGSCGGCSWLVCNTDSQETSIDFLKKTIAVSNDIANKMVEKACVVPALKTAFHVENAVKGSAYFGNQNICEKMAEWGEFVPYCNYSKNSYEIAYAHGEMMNEYIKGVTSVEEMLQELYKEAQTIEGNE